MRRKRKKYLDLPFVVVMAKEPRVIYLWSTLEKESNLLVMAKKPWLWSWGGNFHIEVGITRWWNQVVELQGFISLWVVLCLTLEIKLMSCLNKGEWSFLAVEWASKFHGWSQPLIRIQLMWSDWIYWPLSKRLWWDVFSTHNWLFGCVGTTIVIWLAC